MQANLRPAGWRCVSALVTLLSSQTMAFAQFSTAIPTVREAPAVRDKELPEFPISLPSRPATTSSTESPSLPPPQATSAAAARSKWLPWLEMDAAKTKLHEGGAPARRAAIHYLASVKCDAYPEAEAALIAALRVDRNESVRLEAAQALAGGCCCTPKTMEALRTAASGSQGDGHPAETSDRVKSVAKQALKQYAARGVNVPNPQTLPPAAQKASRDLQLTSLRTPPHSIRAAGSKTQPTNADLRFAESAGATGRSAAAAGTSATSRVPEIRLRPIGVIPPAE